MTCTGGLGQCPARSRAQNLLASSTSVRALRLLPCLQTGKCGDDTLSPVGYSGAGASRDLAVSSVQSYSCGFRENHTQAPILLMVGQRQNLWAQIGIQSLKACPVSRGTWNATFDELLGGTAWNQKLESLFPTGVALRLECESESPGGLSNHSWLGPTPTL